MIWYCQKLSGKKSKSVFDFLTYSRETGFSFSYAEVEALLGAIGASNEIDRVRKFESSNQVVSPHARSRAQCFL